MLWNPFRLLIETKKYPSARLVRSPLYLRYADTFQVLYGDFIENDLGILDYLLILPRLAQILAIEMKGFKNPAARIAKFFVIFIAVFLNIIKFLTAGILLLPASPFIILAHLIAKPELKATNEKIHHLKIKPLEHIREQNKKDLPLSELLKDEKEFSQVLDSERSKLGLLIKPIFKEDSWNDTVRYHCGSIDQKTAPWALGLFGSEFCGCNGPSSQSPLQDSRGPLKGVIEVKPENKKGIEAILKTNMFFATQALEDFNNDMVDATLKQLGCH